MDDPTHKKPYRRSVTPGLRRLLYFIFGLMAILGTNSCYLSSVTFLEWYSGETFQNYFYQYMFLAHLALGLILIVPFLIFGIRHMLAAKDRKNRRAVRVGYALFSVCIAVLVTGIMLMRVGGFDLRQPLARSVVYWCHFACPLVAVWLYWLHRLTGPKIKWRIGFGFATLAAVTVFVMIVMHSQDPRKWNAKGPDSGAKYFEPSLARTVSGNFIEAKTLMNDQYCVKCHADVHRDWSKSVHRFSSFNNPAYLASIHETRTVALKRDGDVQISRWCAGCHDPVPFFSGAFDDPDYDLLNHSTSQAGITCTACHAITHINSNRGNGDYTIEAPLHYPFAFSENKILQWVNNQLVKAKPAFHNKTFLKPFHKTAEFCAACHKVHLPYAVNHYKEFLRGQNHYDNYLLSGVSGHGARSFYYPPKAIDNCAECHMPLKESSDFGARFFADAKQLSVHNHLFPDVNTAIPWLNDDIATIEAHKDFLKGVMRVDIFGIREGAEIDGRLTAPIRPSIPTLESEKSYLFEIVIRTLKMGHLFTQGTVDSNEVWLDVTVRRGETIIGRSGGMDAEKGNEVDRWAHFVNVFMLDKNGNRINRRNAQDIFTPLYNHQIPPGAAQTVHYEFTVPKDAGEITLDVKLKYRKFDQEYMQFIAETNAQLGAMIKGYDGQSVYRNDLPVVTLAEDTVTFNRSEPAEGSSPTDDFPLWQRWNDYGIGLLLKGKAELRQAEEAFKEVEKLNRFDGPINLTRVYLAEGRLTDAVDSIGRAEKFMNDKGFPRWTWAWLAGDAARQQGFLQQAEKSIRSVLEDKTQEMIDRGFDFSLDYEILNLHGQILFDLGRQFARMARSRGPESDAAIQSKKYFQLATQQFKKTLSIDSENVTAHYNLQLLYNELGKSQEADEHQRLHAIFKPDDNARDQAVRLAREKYPAANFAAESVVKYPLQRQDAPGLKSAK